MYYDFNHADSTEHMGAYVFKDSKELTELTYDPTSNTLKFVKNTVKSELINLGERTVFVINGYVKNTELPQDLILLFKKEK